MLWGDTVMRLFIVFVAAFLLAACAAPINMKKAAIYAEGCFGFQAQDEWWKSRRACARAITNAELARADDRTLALLWYEYGRSSGVICDYGEATRGLEKALQLDRATGGPVFMSLMEMARLAMAQAQWEEAVKHYEQLWPLLPEQAAEADPLGMADALEEEAQAYRQLGREVEAETRKTRASQLRAQNPGKTSNTDITPYGQFCDQDS